MKYTMLLLVLLFGVGCGSNADSPTVSANPDPTVVPPSSKSGSNSSSRFGGDAKSMNRTAQSVESDKSVRRKLKKSKHPDWNLRNRNPLNQALLNAALDGDTAEIKRLLADGADPNTANEGYNTFTALMLTTVFDHIDTMKVLLEQGADPNKKAEFPPMQPNDPNAVSGITLAMRASGSRAMLKLLAKYGADFRGADSRGENAFMYEAMFDPACVKLLLAGGLDPNQRDNEGNTALLWLMVQYRRTFKTAPACARLLIAAGVDVNARNNDGKTALGLALEWNQTEMPNILRKAGGKE